MHQEKFPKLVVGLGELLWDLLPDGARLGGAVSNFAVMAARLGDRAVCASRVGDDSLGRGARERLAQLLPGNPFVQIDSQHPTGTVSVKFEDGQPGYGIACPVAWDFLQMTSEWCDLAGQAQAVCFGTLAQREPVARRTIEDFLAATAPGCVRVFDVNLRPPFYSRAVIERSLGCATVIKMNDAELPVVLRLLGMTLDWPTRDAAQSAQADALLAGAHLLLARFPVEMVCVTLGGAGSLLATRAEVDRHPGIPTRVVDTVGAGDAFTAAFTHEYLRGAPLALMSEAGNTWGSWAASQPGAMPDLDVSVRGSISSEALRRFAVRSGISEGEAERWKE